MALPSTNELMSCVVGSVYFCKFFFDFGVSAFVTNFFPASTAALFPNLKSFLRTFLGYAFPYIEGGRYNLSNGASRKNSG